MSKPLPARASLRQLQIQAKELAAELKSGAAEARARFAAATGSPPAAEARLHQAQLAIAREHGFKNWGDLKREVSRREQQEHESVLESFRQIVRRGDVAGFRRLLVAHPGLHLKLDDPLFDFDSPAILTAVARKDVAMVDALLEAGANINQRSQWKAGGFGVLDHVDDAMAAELIARGAALDVHSAAALGKLDQLRQMLDASPALVNARGGDGGTPLHFAKSLEVVELLLERGADVTIRDLDHGSTAAMWQVRKRDVLYRLIEAGSPIDIFMACVHGDLALAERALREDADCLGSYVSHRMGDGKFAPDTGGNYYNWQIGHAARPIPIAAKFGHHQLVRHLLERAKPIDRVIALCFIGNTEEARSIVAGHPDLFQEMDARAARALPDAIHFREREAATTMLAIGFPLTGRGMDGGSALHVASWLGEAELVRALIQKGAALEDRNNRYGSTAIEWACHGSIHSGPDKAADHVGTVRALFEAGADTTRLPPLSRNQDPPWASPAVISFLKAQTNRSDLAAT